MFSVPPDSSPRDKSLVALRRPRGTAAAVVRENMAPACFLNRPTVQQALISSQRHSKKPGNARFPGFFYTMHETGALMEKKGKAVPAEDRAGKPAGPFRNRFVSFSDPARRRRPEAVLCGEGDGSHAQESRRRSRRTFFALRRSSARVMPPSLPRLSSRLASGR